MAFFPKSERRLRREAADWLAKMQGEPSADERDRFRTWYEADEAHARVYDRLAARWQQAAFLRPELTRRDDPGLPAPRHSQPGLLALAAVVLASLALAVFLLGSRALDPGASDAASGPLRLASKVGEIRRVELVDGSSILLDADTSVLVRFDGAARRIDLEKGRARFRVAREQRPFSVATALGRVVAKGTTFDVSLGTGRMGVFLLEGRVEVEGPAVDRHGGAIALTPGEKLSLAEDTGRPRAVRASKGEALWPDGMLQFDATPLDHAIAEANRYSARKILLGDPSLAALLVSGAYRAGDADGLARSLGEAFGIAVTRSSEGHLILGNRTARTG